MKSSRPFFLFFLSIALLLFLPGCQQKNPHRTDSQILSITVFPGEGSKSFTSEDLNGQYEGDLTYVFLENVTLAVNGKQVDLADAIRNGDITVDGLIGDAKRDAANGFCRTSASSKNGLANFLYSYPDFSLEVIDDIYETPDGQQHHIALLAIHKAGDTTADRVFLAEGGETNEFIDREDWGLSLKVENTSSESITISIEQSGGQQFGDLVITDHMLYSQQGGIWISKGELTIPPFPLNMNGTTEYSAALVEYYGKLPSGDYMLKLYITDEYDPGNIHPLCRNYYDVQSYILHFTVS